MDSQTKLESLRKYAKLLDSQFKLPGINFRFGIDPILNLIPILGTFSGLISGFGFIFLAHKHDISGKVKALMFKNLIIDYFFGLIPIYGTIKDFFYKANQKNMILIEEHILEGKHQGSGLKIFLWMILITLLLSLISILLFTWLLTFILKSLGL